MSEEITHGERPRRAAFLFTALAIAVGATAGGLYAYYVGCKTGTCPITRGVPSSSLAGGVMGALIGWPGRRRQ